MIVVRVTEGLGNQLFQYAMGRALALRHGTTLKLDTSWFDTDQGGSGRRSPLRRSALNAFAIDPQPLTRWDRAVYCPSRTVGGRWLDKVLRLGGRRIAPIHREWHRSFEPSNRLLGPDAYLDGYWQSERYFDDVQQTIRAELELRPLPEVEHARDYLRCRRQNAGGALVGVHVRRSDLQPVVVNGQVSRQYGPPTSAPYVQAAMRLFDATARFVIVAEPGDRSWCRDKLSGERVMFYDGTSELADFALLQGCDHHVIANSTFSWWAAWLNGTTGQQVIAPAQWMWPDTKPRSHNNDVIPMRWTQLPPDADDLADAQRIKPA